MLYTLIRLPVQLFDPRGRAGRRDFVAVAVALLVIQVLGVLALAWLEEEWGRVSALPLNGLLIYMAVCATCRRLHDIGRSGWWLPLGLLAWIAAGLIVALLLGSVLGPAAIQPGAPAFWVVFLLLLIPPLLAALWLHLEEGEASPNRFGPPIPDDKVVFQADLGGCSPPLPTRPTLDFGKLWAQVPAATPTALRQQRNAHGYARRQSYAAAPREGSQA